MQRLETLEEYSEYYVLCIVCECQCCQCCLCYTLTEEGRDWIAIVLSIELFTYPNFQDKGDKLTCHSLCVQVHKINETCTEYLCCYMWLLCEMCVFEVMCRVTYFCSLKEDRLPIMSIGKYPLRRLTSLK